MPRRLLCKFLYRHNHFVLSAVAGLCGISIWNFWRKVQLCSKWWHNFKSSPSVHRKSSSATFFHPWLLYIFLLAVIVRHVMMWSCFWFWSAFILKLMAQSISSYSCWNLYTFFGESNHQNPSLVAWIVSSFLSIFIPTYIKRTSIQWKKFQFTLKELAP